MKIFYDDYTKILHLGKVMIGLGGFTDWKLLHYKSQDFGWHYFRLGKLAIRI